MEDVISRLELEEKKTYDLAVYKTAKELEGNSTDKIATKLETGEETSIYTTSIAVKEVKEKVPTVTNDVKRATYDVSSYQSKDKPPSTESEGF